MIITGIGNNGGIGITTFLANFFSILKEKNINAYWLSLSDQIPPLLYNPNSEWDEQHILYRQVPKWERTHCKFCNECEKVCECGAISRYGDFYVVYSELCISCAACISACKKQALIFENKKIGSIESLHSDSSILRVNLNQREIFSPWHTKLIFEKIQQSFSRESIVIVDISSGFRELWVDLIDFSDYVILYTNDLPMWETLYKSLAHDQAQVILAVNENYSDAFSEAGYSFALSIPHNKIINEEAINGKKITDDNYQYIIQELLLKLNLI